MKTANVSLPELVLGEQAIEPLSLITGVSGSGKSFLAANAKFKGLKVVHLDLLASKQEGKWIVDVAKIPQDTDVAIGWCDNLEAVANTLRDLFEEGEPLTMYWIQPSSEIFRQANAAKAQDADDSLSKWKQDWAAKAKWTDNEVEKWLSSKLSLITAKVKPEKLIMVANTDLKAPITKGWHESAAKADAGTSAKGDPQTGREVESTEYQSNT